MRWAVSWRSPGRSIATRHGRPDGCSPMAATSPPSSISADVTPSCCKARVTSSSAWPLAMPQRSRVKSARDLRTRPPRASIASNDPEPPSMRPKPNRATAGPTVGSKAPSVARATSRLAETTRQTSPGMACQSVLGSALKREMSESVRQGDICRSTRRMTASINGRRRDSSNRGPPERRQVLPNARPPKDWVAAEAGWMAANESAALPARNPRRDSAIVRPRNRR